MSELRSEIKFDWPQSGDPWLALSKHVRREIERGNLISAESACMVTATFTMKENGSRYHVSAPGLASLSDKLLELLHNTGAIDEDAVTQLNIGKVLPGPNAVRVTPGVRVSIMIIGGQPGD